MAARQNDKRVNDSFYSNSSCQLENKINREIGPNDVITDDENYDCNFCDRDFRTERGRTIHMSKSHKKEYANLQVIKKIYNFCSYLK